MVMLLLLPAMIMSVDLIDRGDTTGGVNVPQRFSKSANDGDSPIYVAPGESPTID